MSNIVLTGNNGSTIALTTPTAPVIQIGSTLVGPQGPAGPQGAPGTAASNVNSTTQVVTQAAHSFSVGQVLRFAGSSYALAKADNAADAEVVGVVATVNDANSFVLMMEGHLVGMSGLTPGAVYFLSPTTAGAITTTEPTAVGQVSKPVLIADSTTSGYFHNYRGLVLGGTGGGGSSGGGGTTVTVRQVTANTSLMNSDETLWVTTAGVVITIPNGTTSTVKHYILMNDSAGSISYTSSGGVLVGSVSTGTLNPGDSRIITPVSTGNWIIT